MRIPLLLTIITLSTIHLHGMKIEKSNPVVYKKIEFKKVSTTPCFQSQNIDTCAHLCDVATKSRDGLLFAYLIQMCLPPDIVQTYIAPHWIEPILKKYKHKLIEYKWLEDDFTIEQINQHKNWQTLSRHDGTYSVVPNMGYTYAMWNENDTELKEYYEINQREGKQFSKLKAVQNNMINTLAINDKEIILCQKKDSNAQCTTVRSMAPITHCLFSNDCTLLAFGSPEIENLNQILIYTIQTNEEIGLSLNGSISAMCSAHRSPIFVMGGDKPSTKELSSMLLIQSKDNIWTLGHIAPITHVEFSPDDTRLLTCSYDEAHNTSILKLWDTSNLDDIKRIVTIRKNDCHVRKAFFICDGKTIVCLLKNGDFALYDGLTGENIDEKGEDITHSFTNKQNDNNPIMIWSNKHELIISAIDDFIQFFSSKIGKWLGVSPEINNPITSIGITTDENTIVFIDSEDNSYQLPLFDKKDLEDIAFIEKRANIVQLYQMLNNQNGIVKNKELDDCDKTHQLILSLQSYIQEQQKIDQ